MTKPILKVRNLNKHFYIPSNGLFRKSKVLKAVHDVSFEIYPSETLGIVGESGCGKSTLGRSILNIIPPTSGSIIWMDQEISTHSIKDMRKLRSEMQIIFQDPLASLNPRMTIGNIISEPLKLFYPEMPKTEIREKVLYWIEQVGLLPDMINRYPHEFSGGQCQRIGIARAMIINPKIIVCDEPVSALDVSIQAQVINLLKDLQQRYKNSLMFISHDLSVVRHISHRIMVLYLGNIMEIADKQSIYDDPLHPYTKGLISAIPIPDPRIERTREKLHIRGELPSPLNPPSGCVFRTRCPFATELCSQKIPMAENVKKGHIIACHHWRDINSA